MIENSVLVFDIVGTTIAYGGDKKREVRHGIPELFENYAASGNYLYLATSDSDAYAERVAKAVKIDGFLKRVWGVPVDPKRGKHYQRILSDMQMTPSEAAARMILTGDSDRDRPADLPGLVFIYDPYGEEHDAEVHKIVAGRLYKEGTGSFVEGFRRLKTEQGSGSRLELQTGLAISLQDIALSATMVTHQVKVIADSAWMRDFQKVS